MNSTINRTFYTCSKETLLLRYTKISKKAVKLGDFLRCSVHIFLEHDGCFWKIIIRILWKYIMKSFQVKHGHCDSITFPPKIFFWKHFIRPLPCWQQDSLLLTGPGIYPQIFHSQVHALQYLFVRGSNKQQRKGAIISNFTKAETFSSLMTTKCSWV